MERSLYKCDVILANLSYGGAISVFLDKKNISYTVMRIIKLKIFPVPVRLHSGYGKLIFLIISPFFAIFKNVTRRLTRLQTMHNVLKYSKTF